MKTIEYIEKGYWQTKTYGDVVREWAKKYGKRTAIVDGDIKLSFSELDEMSEKLACYLLSKGLKIGDSVILQLTNTVSLPIAYFALFKIGVVPIPVYPALREREIASLAATAKAKAYICAEEYLDYDYHELVEKVCRSANSIEYVIYETEIVNCCFNSDNTVAVDYPMPKYTDTALLLLSGGSTGIPKLIERTHADHYYSVRLMSEICKIDESSVFLAAMPLTHNFFIVGPGLLGTLEGGGKVVMASAPSPDEILRLIDEERVTITALVPAVAKVCLEMQSFFDEYSTDSLQIMQLGGSLVEKNLVEKTENILGCKVQQIYGMSEGIICCTRLNDIPEVVYNTQGKEISAGDEIKIIDVDEIEVPDGEVGELAARGPYTVTHYYENVHPEKFTSDGFYKTGDKAVRRSDGNIVILGRADDLINKGGEKIMPVEIENILKNHDEVSDAIVMGINNEIMGMEICAFIISSNPDISQEDMVRFLREKELAEYKIPDRVVLMEQWPLTAVGKVDKKALEKMI